MKHTNACECAGCLYGTWLQQPPVEPVDDHITIQDTTFDAVGVAYNALFNEWRVGWLIRGIGEGDEGVGYSTIAGWNGIIEFYRRLRQEKSE